MLKSGGGREGYGPNDLVHIDFCGPFSPSLGGNLYMVYAVDRGTGYIKNYACRRKSEGLAVFKRCVVEMSLAAGTPIKCMRGDNNAVWTSRAFREYCADAGIGMQFSPPGAQAYDGVAESAIQRTNKAAMASRRAAARRLGPGGFSCVPGLDKRGDKLWAESAKYAAQALNQSASSANPGRLFPQELYTGKKGPFRMLPFFQYGFMRNVRRIKLDDQAVECYFLNGGDNQGR